MTENHERALGRVEGKLDWLIKEQIRETENRKTIYMQLETIRMDAEKKKQQINNLNTRVLNIEKPVAEFSKWRERTIGVAMFLTIISAVIGGTLATYWQKIISVFKG